MACGEGWIEVPESWRPVVIPCQHWSHGDDCTLGIRPSPNLPTKAAIDLYPSLCLFEPTVVSVGRGTDAPFEQLGHPEVALGEHVFTPRPIPGAAPHPKHEGAQCQGQKLTSLALVWREEANAQERMQSRAFRSNRCGLGRTRGVKRTKVRWTGSSRPLLFRQTRRHGRRQIEP